MLQLKLPTFSQTFLSLFYIGVREYHTLFIIRIKAILVLEDALLLGVQENWMSQGNGKKSRSLECEQGPFHPQADLMGLRILQLCHPARCPWWTWADPIGGLETLAWGCNLSMLSSPRPGFEPITFVVFPTVRYKSPWWPSPKLFLFPCWNKVSWAALQRPMPLHTAEEKLGYVNSSGLFLDQYPD